MAARRLRLWYAAGSCKDCNSELILRAVAEALTWDRMGPWPWILSHGCDHLRVPSSSRVDLANFLFLAELHP
jgi:hypothetical protein